MTTLDGLLEPSILFTSSKEVLGHYNIEKINEKKKEEKEKEKGEEKGDSAEKEKECVEGEPEEIDEENVTTVPNKLFCEFGDGLMFILYDTFVERQGPRIRYVQSQKLEIVFGVLF